VADDRTRVDFDARYDAGSPPWDIGRPQAAFEDVPLHGRVLDIGCGTGEHALMAASRGFDATGIDAAPKAIALAEQKASDRGLTARFVIWSALELGRLGEQFDTVLDSGLFHVFSDEDRARYVENLAAATTDGGRYFMLCFSDRQPGDWGPRRVTRDEIERSFAGGWRVDAIEGAILKVNVDPDEVHAWFASITRIS
jgi:cyclopropane fatty-acyl-phospholipid synthase-like methyltransferase